MTPLLSVAIARRAPFARSISRLALVLLAAVLPCASQALTRFSCVAAGDATETSAILWVRATVPRQDPAPSLVAEVATDAEFRHVEFRAEVAADPARDGIAKLQAAPLAAGTLHFYRFRAGDGAVSSVGRLRTAPPASERRGVRLAFSGDADGRWRPFPSLQGIAARGLDFFVFLGDTMYEGSSGRPMDGPPRHSPAAADPFADPARALSDYRRKYLENITPVNPGGAAGLCDLFESTGTYTLIDNHELGNGRAQSGGAPAQAAILGAEPDVTPGPPFMNHSEEFRTLVRAYADYHPIREVLQHEPGDARSDGTLRLWFEQRWGRLLTFVNLDDRSYRDARLRSGSARDDDGERADNPGRTMLGSVQLAWVQRTLAQAQRDGVTWKIVAVSSPIDETGGDFGDDTDGGKSWAGGYRAERRELLSFIAREGIDNVVFITTDDHLIRVNPLWYPDAAPRPEQRAAHRAGNSFTIVAGPIGAAGPDMMASHEFDGGPDCPSIGALFALAMPLMGERRLANCIASHEMRQGLHPLGLPAGFPGLRNVRREGKPAGPPEPVDFFSRDTFNYCEITVAADTGVLRVELRGIRAYPASTFAEADPSNPVHEILSFEIAPRS
jgi:alkaline phosphatase D